MQWTNHLIHLRRCNRLSGVFLDTDANWNGAVLTQFGCFVSDICFSIVVTMCFGLFFHQIEYGLAASNARTEIIFIRRQWVSAKKMAKICFKFKLFFYVNASNFVRLEITPKNVNSIWLEILFISVIFIANLTSIWTFLIISAWENIIFTNKLPLF